MDDFFKDWLAINFFFGKLVLNLFPYIIIPSEKKYLNFSFHFVQIDLVMEISLCMSMKRNSGNFSFEII